MVPTFDRRSLCIALGLAPLGPALRAAGGEREDPSDVELTKLWRGLAAGDRSEIGLWFRSECDGLRNLQAELVRSVFFSLDVPRYEWPVAPADPPLYDAREHAPAQPIERHFVDDDSAVARRWRERVAARGRHRLRPAWRYDYGARSVVLDGDRADLDRLFENALAGYLPEQDLAEALVERALDDGSQQKVLAAFAHAYADRAGNAYRDVTLYDAWGSGEEIEMPDVECLGIVHDVLGDWKKWKAPVDPSQHKKLYGRIGELFAAARRHRGLRTALARTFASAEPVLADGYDASLATLHALWVGAENDPARLAPKLPDPDDWLSWLEQRGKELTRERELGNAVQERRRVLAANAAEVRARLVWVMREYGALGR